ncbi:MAG TPA: hypothetical protein VL490_01440 [Mucilaginibacter sp.]|jgi:hypothetical protein|nr:hypothetical protein [Mucilaginibacter sp.]
MLFRSKEKTIKMVQYIFLISGVYGILMLLPQFFRENIFAPLTHPEFFYGFLIVTMGFQAIFLLIASNPARYRQAMLVCLIPKAGFVSTCYLLFIQNRLAKDMFITSFGDMLMLLLFCYSYIITSAKFLAKQSGTRETK